jgi:DNA-directed RNA polymerase subunit beta'
LRTVKNKDGKHVVLNRGGAITIHDTNGKELQRFPNISYGAIVSAGNGEKINANERVATWDPHNILILSEVDGKLKFVDIVEGVTMKRELDEVSGILHRVIMEHKAQWHPQIQVLDEKGVVLASYALPSSSHISQDIEDGKKVHGGDVLSRIPKEKSITRDITGGLPRVAELFEARRPKEVALTAEIDGLVQLAGITKGMRRVIIKPDFGEERHYAIPLHRHLHVRSGERVQAGEQLTDGAVDPHDVLRIKGQKEVQKFLLNEIQEVYRLQGVGINDKHIEVIVRQMMRKVTVKEIGDTTFLFDQQVDRFTFDEENDRVAKLGGQLAQADPKLLGITKASLETESFISAASFQETTRVLTEAAVQGKTDHLRGLKENVIMGRLIPAGTGMPNSPKSGILKSSVELERKEQQEARQRAAVAALSAIKSDDETEQVELDIPVAVGDNASSDDATEE